MNPVDKDGTETVVKVSVCCMTFNHAEYIADALKGFLNQETDFPYEVIVHDDDSTDGTIEILRDFEERYPGKLRVLYEEYNRYHEINDYLLEILAPAARGEYIAFCEGDDYWIDTGKLQRQHDFLEANQDYSYCFHNAVIEDFAATLFYRSSQETEDCEKSLDELIVRGGGLANCTGSYFFRKQALENPLPFLYKAAVGDYPWMFTLALRGKVFWMAKPMLVYRNGHPGSWTTEQRQSAASSLKRAENDLITLAEFDANTEGQFSQSIQIRVASVEDSKNYNKKLLAAISKNLSLSAIWNDHTLDTKSRIRFCLARILSPGLYERVLRVYERRVMNARRDQVALEENAYCEGLIREYRESER